MGRSRYIPESHLTYFGIFCHKYRAVILFADAQSALAACADQGSAAFRNDIAGGGALSYESEDCVFRCGRDTFE